MRGEFLRARARSLRFSEEVVILREEQRRVLESLEREAKTWEQRAALAGRKECPITRQGAVAYAVRQSRLRRKLADQFRSSWSAGVVIEPDVRPPHEVLNGLEGGLYTINEDSDDEDGALKGAARGLLDGYISDD